MTAKEVRWPGKELTAKEFYNKVTVTRYRPEAKFAWSAGEAMSRFLAELQRGRLIARSCSSCKRVLFPPRMFCEECFRPTDAWVYVRDTGTIETYSISYIDLDAKRIETPVYVGVVSVDGASPKMGIMHYFGEVAPETIRIGLRVKAEWKPAHEREGSVLDIRYWRPLRRGE
ncbi:MAG: Zn-ribbon domain-containing OB-fold protein [Methanobacteriota archaeon]|nr:MAG: Zn-ribbon domain-containing OB-fold protein [Euryarchaeota archaeon]